MKTKIFFLTFFSLLLTLALVSYANAQTCADPWSGETGQCRSGCGSDEHEIGGTCLGQTCCAAGGSGEDTSCQGQGDMCGGSYGSCCSPYSCYEESSSLSTCLMSGYTGGDTGGTTTDNSTSTTYDYNYTSGTSGGGWNPGNYAMFGLPEGRIYDIIYNFLFWILALFGAFGLIGFVISGIMYLTSAGDDTQIEKAKKAMKWSLVGVIVGLAGLVIILAVDELLSGWSTRF